MTVALYASSSALDTDFVARLTDVYPDGRSINITEGVIRARLREGIWGRPKLMEPGCIYEFTIDLQVTSNLFRAGHRLRLQITSSNFPLWDRNLNTGNHPATDTQMVVARQTVYHDREHPSRLRLPVVGVGRANVVGPLPVSRSGTSGEVGLTAQRPGGRVRTPLHGTAPVQPTRPRSASA